jgi:hypothetical protein
MMMMIYCNNNSNGKYWAIVAQNYPDHPRIWIAERPLYLFTRPQKTVILTFTTVGISNAIYNEHLKYTLSKKALIVNSKIL